MCTSEPFLANLLLHFYLQVNHLHELADLAPSQKAFPILSRMVSYRVEGKWHPQVVVNF